jgi:hypothetical protein
MGYNDSNVKYNNLSVILYTAIILPYKIAFVDMDSDFDNIVDIFFNVTLSIDIFLSFFSAYTDHEDNVVKNRAKIISKYLFGWFIIDIVSILPISYFTDDQSNGKLNNLARLTRIPKLYRLIRLTK